MNDVGKLKQLAVCFYGSSGENEDEILPKYRTLINQIASNILSLDFNRFKVITGGYHGIMFLIADAFKQKAKELNKSVQIIGITCDAYPLEDLNSPDYRQYNDINSVNDIVIHTESFPARIQAMIEVADVFIILPGKQGTLSEFLMTAESFGFTIEALKHKKAQIFVHHFWKKLIENKRFFRDVENIDYFKNISEFSVLLRELPYQELKYYKRDFLDLTITDKTVKLEQPFKNYFRNLQNILHGKLTDDPSLQQRLSYYENILAVDFGSVLKDNSSSNSSEGEFITKSTSEYQQYLQEFFEGHNSIMFDAKHSEFEVEYFNGEVIRNPVLKDEGKKGIPVYSEDKDSASFNDWAAFVKLKDYGQTLIWRSITQRGENNSYQLNLSLFLLFNCHLPSRKIEKIRQLTDEFFINVSSRKIADLFEKKEVELTKQATRAAISQVMARNTSHNIGAHVMNKLIGNMAELPMFKFNDEKTNYQSAFQENLKILHEEIKKKTDNDPELEGISDIQREKVLKHRILLEQISYFNNYVKCRMDYLADISFGTPLMQTNKKAYGDLFLELDKVRLLLEHISGLSAWRYKIVFKLNGKELGNENDLLVAIPNDILGTQAFYNILENIIRNSAKHTQKPDDNFLTIFTVNFIDDPNKINCSGEKEKVNILSELIAVEIYDNIPITDTHPIILIEEEKKEYNLKTKKEADNELKSNIDKLVFRQNKKLNEDILQENKLRSSALGLIEMDASAAYLRKRDVSYINHPSYEIEYNDTWSRDSELNRQDNHDPIKLRGINCRHFLKAFKGPSFSYEVKNNSTTQKLEGHCLGYRFFLHRPAVVLVVTDILENTDSEETKKKNKERKAELKKDGIWVVAKKEFKEDLEDKKEGDKIINAGKVYNHEFVLYANDEAEIKPIIEAYKTSLPIRILKVNRIKLATLLDVKEETVQIVSNEVRKPVTQTISDTWEQFCWQEWRKDDKDLFIVPKYEPTPGDYIQAVFLDHLYLPDGTVDSAKIEEAKKIFTSGNYYIEALSSLAQSKLPDFYRITNDIKKDTNEKFKIYGIKVNDFPVLRQKIKEAVFTKVIVIDERIQEAAEHRVFMEIPFKSLYRKMGIVVPDKNTEIDLSDNSYSKDLISKIKVYLGLEKDKQKKIDIQCVLENIEDTDFILIHYSILERMFEKKDINENIKAIADKGINVVITSGRGVPDNLTPKARFVNLSSVITTFIDIRSKYSINYLLNSSRRSNKI